VTNLPSKQKLIELLADRSRMHDAFRLAETAFSEGKAEGSSEELNAFDIAHGEVLDWLNDTDHLDELLGFLRAVETHHELCDTRDVNAEGIRKPCNCKGRTVETTAEPTPCEHLRSELLADKTKDGEPLFQMRKCLDCTLIFRVRSSLKTGAEHG
jgi:hypothetical protein